MNPINNTSSIAATTSKNTDTPAELVAAANTGPQKLADSQAVMQDFQKTVNAIQGPAKSLEISMHKETHSIMIKVKNKDTGELIREAPPEKILDALAKLMEITGLIVDKKV
jgi:flagellar protein FlaG